MELLVFCKNAQNVDVKSQKPAAHLPGVEAKFAKTSESHVGKLGVAIHARQAALVTQTGNRQLGALIPRSQLFT